MRFPTPREYEKHEVSYGPPIRVSNGFRCQIPMDQRLREYAMDNCTDISVVLRHAMHEYFEKRGINAYMPTGMN